MYQDQVNKYIEEYVPECILTKTEKDYVQQHKNVLRIMRHIPKIKINFVYDYYDNSNSKY